MKLWSIQHRIAYENLQETGVLRANEQHLFCEEEFRFAYDWMAEQMERRVGKAPEGVRYPIWAWYQWEGRRKRPDMRHHRRWGEPGTPIVLMTLEVPDELVLLSDFDMWHCVLGNGYLADTEEEEDPATEQEIRESWSRIFDWKRIQSNWAVPKTTQATFWELRKDWVEKAEYFVSA